jgi:DNA-binding NtrC family response regulator
MIVDPKLTRSNPIHDQENKSLRSPNLFTIWLDKAFIRRYRGEMKYGCTVLVVEDNEGIVFAVKNLFENENCRVISSQNGIDSIAALRQIPVRPNVILLDVSFPYNPETLLQALHSVEALSEVPVIQMSTRSQTDHSRGVIAKPFCLDTLISFVERAIPDTKNHAKRHGDPIHQS